MKNAYFLWIKGIRGLNLTMRQVLVNKTGNSKSKSNWK